MFDLKLLLMVLNVLAILVSIVLFIEMWGGSVASFFGGLIP